MTDSPLYSTSPTSSQRPSLRVPLASMPESPSFAPAPTSSPAAASRSGASTRPFNHSRSQSMSDHPPSSPPANHAEQPPLVRRHHTLGGAASRLVKQERSRVRLALQGAGLSEEDQQFYVPQSPVRGGPMWSDGGHASASASTLAALSPTQSRPVSGTSSATASWGGSELDSLNSTSFFPLTASPASLASPSSFDTPSLASAKRSSFVVLRGARGDSELTERRKSCSTLPPPTSEYHLPQTPPRPGLEHRNSLKPFLEAELGEEEWERGLQDERDKEELELKRKDDDQLAHSFGARPSPPHSHSSPFHTRVGSPFGSHTRPSTFSSHSHQSIGSVASSDVWRGDGEEAAALRRRQSLNNFRQEDSSASEAWPPHARGASEEQLLSSLSLSSAGFSRSLSGTGPPSLNLSHGSSTPHSSLSHSNSLSSHGHSQLGNGGALSPVGGFPRSPWSPTVEETKQLGMGIVVGSSPKQSGLSRGGSGSSRGSVDRYGDDIGRVAEEMGGLEIEGSEVAETPKPSTPQGGESAVEPTPRPLPRSLSSSESSTTPSRRLPPLMTNPDVLASLGQPKGTSQLPSFLSRQGPASAAAFVPPIGHSHAQLGSQPRPDFSSMPSLPEPSRGNFTAAPGAGGADWLRQKELLVGSSASLAPPFSTAVGVNPAAEAWPSGGGFGVGLAMQQQQQIQVLQSQMQQAMQAMDMMKAHGVQIPPGFTGMRNGGGAQGRQQGMDGFSAPYPTMPGEGGVATMPKTVGGVGPSTSLESPIDIPSLIATKGYNPPVFELRPPNARFFVIKSYTEEDVHKSLKYEIWASTDLGNKRLDRAFRESADKGPLYLFFSVNGSGHFAGMAQMLTPVDYAMTSNVWASDKWKGVLKVRWIYIKDVPLASLRHIRLSNTPENKPVTSSRDTQEVPYEQGCEVLRILSSYQSRTSLLQDFAWYEARQEAAQAVPGSAPTTQPQQPPHQPHYAARPPPPQQQQQYQQPHQQQQQQQQHQQYPQQQAFNGPSPTGIPPMGMVGNAHGGGRRFFSGGGRGGPGAAF